MNGPLDFGFYLKEEQKTALKFAVLPTGYGSNDLYRMTFYPRMLAPMIYLYRIVTSGAGPRAVGTERGRWSDLEMSDTCSTHRSRVPRRRLGGYKRGATTVKDERGPGLGFILCLVFICARQSTVRGCRAVLSLFGY